MFYLDIIFNIFSKNKKNSIEETTEKLEKIKEIHSLSYCSIIFLMDEDLLYYDIYCYD